MRVVAIVLAGPCGTGPTGRANGARGPCGPSGFLWALEPTPYPLKLVSGTSCEMAGYTALSRVGLRPGPYMEELLSNKLLIYERTAQTRRSTFGRVVQSGRGAFTGVLCRLALRPTGERT